MEGTAMSDGIWSALSGAVSHVTALDIAANNIANASTPGFRADHLVFHEYLGRAAAGTARQAGPGLRSTTISTVVPDQSQGTIVQTGRGLDAAIRGEGYFVVSTAQGDRYTRVGSFDVAKDGTLVTRTGDTVLGADRKRIVLPRDASGMRITADGTIEVSGQPAGQLMTVSFDRKAVLEKEGSVLLRRAQGTPAPTQARVSLESGALEQSNMSAVQGMMDIVSASRGFEACERVIDAFRDEDRRAAMAIAGKG
jgi:flagellar basal-body rod protein FlgF